MKDHIDDPATSRIEGTYRWKDDVIHYYNQEKNLDVMTKVNGEFISGWELSPTQKAELVENKNVF